MVKKVWGQAQKYDKWTWNLLAGQVWPESPVISTLNSDEFGIVAYFSLKSSKTKFEVWGLNVAIWNKDDIEFDYCGSNQMVPSETHVWLPIRD